MRRYIKSYLLIAILLFSITGFAQSNFKLELAGIATLDLPEKPAETALPNAAGIYYKVSTPTHNYLVIMLKIDTAQLQVQTIKDLDTFYSGIVDGAADSTKNRKLISLKQMNIANFRGIDFKYFDASTGKTFTAYQRVVMLDHVVFMYSFMVYDDTTTALQAERERFLNSFKVIKPNARQI